MFHSLCAAWCLAQSQSLFNLGHKHSFKELCNDFPPTLCWLCLCVSLPLVDRFLQIAQLPPPEISRRNALRGAFRCRRVGVDSLLVQQMRYSVHSVRVMRRCFVEFSLMCILLEERESNSIDKFNVVARFFGSAKLLNGIRRKAKIESHILSAHSIANPNDSARISNSKNPFIA